MMSTMDSSLFRQHMDHHKTRPVVVGAPYVLCVFVVGVVLLGVGTFVTSHAHQKDTSDPILLVVGPGLLGLGGLLLLGSMFVCVVACCRNRHIRESLSDELFTVGASTFYDVKGLVHSGVDNDEEGGLAPSRHHRQASTRGVTNFAGPNHSQAVMMLANTVAEERERQRMASHQYARHMSHEALAQLDSRGYYNLPLGYPSDLPLDPQGRLDPALLDHLGLERLHRAEPHPHLPWDIDLVDTEDSNYRVRERAHSMSVRCPVAQMAPVQHRLRRNITFSPTSRARMQRQQQQQQQLHESQLLHATDLSQHPGPQRKRSSRCRKGNKATPDKSAPGVMVHQLPQCDPDLLHALGLVSDKPRLIRGISEEGVLDHGYHYHTDAWQENPDITHSSLGNPRRRPSVVMGVRGKQRQAQQTSQAYRHPSSIYASDMDLHRPTSGLARSKEARASPNPGIMNNFTTHPGANGRTNLTGSSPNLLLPPSDSSLPPTHLDERRDDITSDNVPQDGSKRDDGSDDLQLNTRRDDGSDSLRLNNSIRGCTPTSMTSSPSASLRPLSSISSESCCSNCCKDGGSHTGEGGVRCQAR